MNDFNQIGKRMPFSESEGYVDSLIDKCAASALAQRSGHHRRTVIRRICFYSSGIAAALLVAFLLFSRFQAQNEYKRIEKSQSLNEVLSSLSDKQVQDVTYYNLDDIPDYDADQASSN